MKKLLATGIGAVSTLALPLTAFAQSVSPCAVGAGSFQGCIPGDIGPIIGSLIQFIFVIAVILALGFLVYGGIKWLTSGGDKEGVAGARNTIIAAIVGLVIIFLAYVILNLVLTFLTGGGFNELSFPSLI